MSERLITIDAHQHYWQFERFAYPWHKQVNLPAMNRDYLPPDILPQMQASGIQYTLLIQADNSPEETLWMLDLARQYPHILGVIGWADLTAPDLEETLAQFGHEPLVRGIRLLPAPREDWSRLTPGLRSLAAAGLTCDLLPDEETLPFALAMMQAHPETRFIVNHCGGLPLIPGGAAHWSQTLQPLARLPQVFLKFSALQGLAEPPPATVETVRSYLECALDLFGAERLILASDWPVSTLSGTYAAWVALIRAATALLSVAEQAALWGQTAIQAYGLSLRS